MDRVEINLFGIKILRFAERKFREGSKSKSGDKFKGNYKDSVISLPMLINEKVLNISQDKLKKNLDSLEEKRLLYKLKGFQQPSLYLITKNAIDLLEGKKKMKISEQPDTLPDTSEIYFNASEITRRNSLEKVKNFIAELYRKQQAGEIPILGISKIFKNENESK